MSLRNLLGVAVLALLPLFLGCEDEEMAWTPDSSALMYRDEDKGWSRYDLKTKSAEQVLKATTQGSQGIAISPRGDQFAVGTITATKDKKLQLQLSIYSRAGDIVQESIRYDICKVTTDYVPDGSWLEWSTNGRIAVFAGTGIGLYDPRTKQLLWLKDYAPYQEGMYIGSNLLPDGTGVIATKADRQGTPDANPTTLPDVALVDWSGRIVRTTKIPPAPQPLRKVLAASSEQKVCFAEYAVWNGATCRLQLQDYRLDINPKTGAAQWFSNPLQLEKHIPNYDPQFSYIALPVGAGGCYVYWKSKEDDNRLELMNIKTKSHEVLAEQADIMGAVRSPDGNKLAITFVDKTKDKEAKQQQTIIIDETGQTVGKFARGEFQILYSVDPGQPAPAPEAAPAPAAPAAEAAAPQ